MPTRKRESKLVAKGRSGVGFMEGNKQARSNEVEFVSAGLAESNSTEVKVFEPAALNLSEVLERVKQRKYEVISAEEKGD